MKVKFCKLSPYWKRVLVVKVFGKYDDCIMSAITELNPKVEESSLFIKVEDKNTIYKMVEKCRNAEEALEDSSLKQDES